jgi:hypothetical protein
VKRAIEGAGNAEDFVGFHDVFISSAHAARPRHYRNRRMRPNEDILEYLFVRGGLAQTSTLVVSLPLAQRARFDNALRLHQDWDFCLRLQRSGGQFHLIPKPLAIWQGDGGEMRVSETPGAERSLAWVRSLEGRVSDKVLWAIKALVVAPRLRPTDPQTAVSYLLSAWREGGIGTLRVLHRLWRLGFLNAAGVRLIWGARSDLLDDGREAST